MVTPLITVLITQEYTVLVHSLLAITTPFALISAHSTRFELIHALRLSKVTRLFVSKKLLQHVTSVAKEVGLSSRKIHVLGGRVKGRISFAELNEAVIANSVPHLPARPAKKDTLAYLVFSSGTGLFCSPSVTL